MKNLLEKMKNYNEVFLLLDIKNNLENFNSKDTFLYLIFKKANWNVGCVIEKFTDEKNYRIFKL